MIKFSEWLRERSIEENATTTASVASVPMRFMTGVDKKGETQGFFGHPDVHFKRKKKGPSDEEPSKESRKDLPGVEDQYDSEYMIPVYRREFPKLS